MDLFLFHHDRYSRLYNCSVLTTAEWYGKGQPSVALGVAIIVVGFLLLVPYIPCLLVIMKSSLYRFSSYKIMLYLGFTDILCLFVNSVITGYVTIVGAEPCPYIDLQYVIGSLALGMWASQCSSCVLLSFNRCVEFWKPRYLHASFQGRRTYVWLLFCVGYSIYITFYTQGFVYSSIQHSWFANPYVGIPEILDKIDVSEYIDGQYIANNVIVTILLPLFYAFLLISVWLKKRRISTPQRRNSKMQTLMTVQSVFICFFTLLTAVVYMTIQFVRLPLGVSIAVNIFWQLSNGAPALIYLIVNRTIRQKVSFILFNKKPSRIAIPTISIVPPMTQFTPNTP